MTTQTPTRAVREEAIADIISKARNEVEGQRLVPVALCTDALLDCFNAATNPEVKSVVRGLLPDFATGSLRKSEDFLGALDHIQQVVALDKQDDLG